MSLDLKALITATPAYVREWGFRAFTTRGGYNELAIDMFDLEASFIALLTEDAVRKGIVNRDALRLWLWHVGPFPRLKACVRDNDEDWATFSTLCRILADHADELDETLADVHRPEPVGNGRRDWHGIRRLSRAALDTETWLRREEVLRKFGITDRTLQRWDAGGLTTVRGFQEEDGWSDPVSVHEWELQSLYLARNMAVVNAALGRRQNQDRDPVDVLDETLDRLAEQGQ